VEIRAFSSSSTQRFQQHFAHRCGLQFAAFFKSSEYVTDWNKHGLGNCGHNRVPWNDANAFCQWLTHQAALQGDDSLEYQLPTEAQWEYAARAGTDTRYISGNEALSLHEFGNVQDASFEVEFTRIDFERNPGFGFIDNNVFTAVCGSYRANSFGLYDMHGNVWEWCRDRYSDRYYAQSPAADPSGPVEGDTRVLRGGSWNDAPWFVRSAFRTSRNPAGRCNLAGFRVVIQSDAAASQKSQ
jgi:formylglycine-generating enzyme required for sulfatase activity